MAIQWNNQGWIPAKQRIAQGAMERIQKILFEAKLAVHASANDQTAQARFVQHFLDLNERVQVSTTIDRMYDRLATNNQIVTMILVPDLQAFNALGFQLPAGVDINNVEAFVTQSSVAPATALNLYVCPAFFSGDVYVPHGPQERSATGTVIHELSHGVGGIGGANGVVVDNGYTWDQGYAQLTANQRARNADTYRAYCQSFDMLPARPQAPVVPGSVANRRQILEGGAAGNP